MGIRTTAAAELLGISPSTLRSWERRYGFPQPGRSPGGHRQYDRADVEALRDAYAETGHAASAVALARGRGGPAPATARRLAAALRDFDEAAADRVAAEALALLGLETVVEELVLGGVELLAPGSAEHGLGVRWASGWLAAQRRLAAPASRPEGILVLDALGPAVVRVAALELVLRRAGLRVLVLPVALAPERLARALAVLAPDLVVLGGEDALDDVGRVVFAARRSRGERVPVCDFAGALGSAAGSTVPRVGPGLLAARDAILALVEPSAARDAPEVAPAPRRNALRVVS